MVNNLKLSIIVLTHSGDDTLYQCLYSIKNQTFKKFKCIIIGYDTTDTCQTIARTICKQDNRFSYIPITGKSLCYAKNLGISLAGNDYTMFIQDNDFLQQDCFEKAVFFIRKYNPQILWTASIQYNIYDNYRSNINTHINGIYTAVDIPFAASERCYIYDKIYRTSLLKNIRFIETEQEQVSNIMFNHDCLLQAKNVVNINYRLMHHYATKNEYEINDEANNESKTQLTQYIDKVNDDNIKKSIEFIIQYNFNDKLNNDLNIDDLNFDNTPLKVALCAIAKNENLYIREWVEWYKNLGISKIFLYDNNELDGERFDEVINDYIESGFVKVIDVRGIEKGRVYDEEGINLQPKCYIEFYEGEGKNYDWICFFDIDEFLNFKHGLSLFSFLNKDTFNDTDTILVSWEHYDDNNLYDYDKRPVVKRFTKKSRLGFHGVKSIVRSNRKIENKAQENLIHCFKLVNHKIKFSNGIIVNELNSHNFYKLSNDIHNKCNVVLNHYKTKTITEYLYRHLGRYWGTGKKYTDNAKTLANCYKDFFLYNIKTNIKENIINNFVKDDKIINYYKKINSLNLDTIINKYNNYIKLLDIKEDLICKKYNKEIGIISLTTWKARINYVYITLCNLLDICPEFHIVLVLSEEEFPNKERDLPNSLKKLISNKLIEILWTPDNYKTCKKLIFTIEKYSSAKVPIISADDDCIYITNYAKELYDKYKENNNYVLRYNMYNLKETWQYSQGPCTLYNPITFKYFLKNKSKFLDLSMAYKDDQVITKICKDNKIKITYLYRGHIFPFIFYNEINATNNNKINIDFTNCYI